MAGVLSGVFLPVVLAVGCLGTLLHYRSDITRTEISTQQLLQAFASNVELRFSSSTGRGRLLMVLQRMEGLSSRTTLDDRLRLAGELQRQLERMPVVSSLYLIYRNGDYFLLRRPDPGRDSLPAGTTAVVESRQRGQGQWLALNLHGEVIGQGVDSQLSRFDPRNRPWYRQTGEPEFNTITPLYRFPQGGLGLSLTHTSSDGRAVTAADLPLSLIDRELEALRITPNTQVALLNARQRVAASTPSHGQQRQERDQAHPPRLEESGLPVLVRVARLSKANTLTRFHQDGQGWHGIVIHLPGEIPGSSNDLVMAIPDRELLAAAITERNRGLALTGLALLGSLALVCVLSQTLSRRLGALARQAAALRRFDFEPQPQTHSRIREVEELGAVLAGGRDTIRRFLEITNLLAAETDVNQLLHRLLQEAMQVAAASGGVLYLDPGHGQPFIPAQRQLPGCPTLPLLEASAMDDLLSGRHIPQAIALAGAHRLALPLKQRNGVLLGALLLWFADEPEPNHVAFATTLSGSAALALETRELIASQKAVFQALVELIAEAIDAKSPHTGGHCRRVPALTMALAQAACNTSSGRYAAFHLDEDDWEAVRLAAWLHDCGKVTTPEFVVDKATKLQTLYDRIHEVRMRFELLKSEAETAYWRAIAAGGDGTVLGQELQETWRALDDDFAFVASCNQGLERMPDGSRERLDTIAGRRWRRTLDNRLGLSHEELELLARQPSPPLPVLEPLLADRPEHRLERPAEIFLAKNNPWQFTMEAPPLLYNRGELHNLAQPYGTLTPEERYKINEHIIQTIVMLSALPLPRHLRQVPELAGGHHERMDGGGYPRGVEAGSLPPVARMMAIADVFEALTAGDRPYKRGKTLAESLAIMASMVRSKHLDGELFALFLKAEVWRHYAEQFLAAEQHTAVDVDGLLALAGLERSAA